MIGSDANDGLVSVKSALNELVNSCHQPNSLLGCFFFFIKFSVYLNFGFLMNTYIHTYIIGHYNPSIGITA